MRVHLDDRDYALLKALSEDGGFTTGHVAERAGINFGGLNRRMRSGAVRSWLMNLKRAGLVDFLDGEKPVCWIRTAAGTAALETE